MNVLTRFHTSGINRLSNLPTRRCNVATTVSGSIVLRLRSLFLGRNHRFFSTPLYSALPRDLQASMPACIQTEPGHRASPSYAVPGLRLTDHWLTAPLDYSGTVPGSLVLFARQVVSVANEGKVLPWLVYLQGGPGFESPRPTDAGGWLGKACEAHQVLLLDQRGTGLSTPLTASSLSQLSGPQEQAALLALFRADSIVRDAELFRTTLLPPGEKWTLLGQSFGGFCAVTYMSFYPEALSRVLLTGGLPPVSPGCSAEGVYRACFQQAEKQTQKFYARFPQDEAAIRAVVLHVHGKGPSGIPLPGGGSLTVEGFQSLGLTALGSAGGFERLHFLIEGAWESCLVENSPPRLSTTFLHQFESWFQFDTNPIYAILHEAIYCQGAASKWAAQRVREEMKAEFDGVRAAEEGRAVPFTGEMIFPWMFHTHTALRPLKDAAQILADKEDWLPLYDTDVLENNEVPCAAAVYYEDLYVNLHLAETTAGGIKGIRTWVSSEYQHSGLREDGPRVLERLLGMLSGAIPLN